MNVNVPVPAVPLAQPQPGPAQLANVGQAVKALHSQCVVHVCATAGGAPGIPDAVVGQGVMNTTQMIAGGIAQQVVVMMQPLLQPLHAHLVRNENLTKRLHNRAIPVGANGQLLPLCKERHPQPAAPGAAAGAAAAFGALPPPGMFPATAVAISELSHAELTALAVFYEEDFGPQTMLLGQRSNRFRSFIYEV